jgi:hypothetical protein
MDKDQILILVRILESNTKILNSYKSILNKVEKIEENISRKFNDKDEENKFMQQIIESSNNSYYTISQNCLT